MGAVITAPILMLVVHKVATCNNHIRAAVLDYSKIVSLIE